MEYKGIDKENLDPTINPKNDFYLYACGGWIKQNPLTDEFSSFGTFDKLRENARNQVKELITGLQNQPEASQKGSIAQKISTLYELGMDEKRLNSEGAEPLRPYIDKIKNLDLKNDLSAFVGEMHLGIDSPFFSSGVGPDPKDSNIYILHVGETGLGLGDRDYYLIDNEENRKIMEAYETYVKKIMSLVGYTPEDGERVWKNLIKIEKEIALHKMTKEERRNPLLRHNIKSIDEMKNDYNFIDWDIYFEELGIKGIKEANVLSPKFLEFMTEFLPSLSEQEIKDYMTFGFISNSTGLLSDDFIDADFELYGRVMSGQLEKKPRWKRAMALPNSMFGEAVGELYVARFFPEENKRYMKGLVENLRNALGSHISNLTWMSRTTKEKALDKLGSMTVKIGYPDKWKDYSEIDIDGEKSYLENVQVAAKWFAQDSYNKWNTPVDKEEWHMTPQTVNAYYSPSTNEICFPAAILQPPFFNIEADDAVNYGGIGVVIGHEMTHAFDDQGRQFDKDGNLNDWWLPEDAEKFNKLSEILVKQFNEVEIEPGLYANGQFTLGENIADQGGLRVALTAYQSIPDDERKVAHDDGFTPLQRFYLSYAGIWANSIREEEKRARTISDPHSLGCNRVNVTLRNIHPFFEAFDIKEGDALYRQPDEQVIIW